MRLIALVALALSLVSCRSAVAPMVEAPVATADVWTERLPEVTSVSFLPRSATLNIEMDKLRPNSLGKHWTFAVRVGSKWLLGPGLADYFAWGHLEGAPSRFLVTYGLAPDCGHDPAPYGDYGNVTTTRSSARAALHPNMLPYFGPVRGAVYIFDTRDMTSPWDPTGYCEWGERVYLEPVQTFAFETPWPASAPDIAEDVVALGRH